MSEYVLFKDENYQGEKQNQRRVLVTANTDLTVLYTRHLYNAQNKTELGNKKVSWTMPITLAFFFFK